ncbi:MAG: 6-carboxytetrahydropterin synthase [Planctomycetota bacterium]|mgnify:CR=1 FL=1|jgi:6-pyruvoyltetrahydropterin/6-carboxytetrahydropterin synthase|nr:6-carboxytetrahydropterin synthase [Planctomycetota bacterium]MDG2142678.1 6-carboxytetrahydropterin synthase [Planctomycetota bacterium]
MKTWSIDLAKEAFRFSGAHFLIFPDGSAERLHGHNYRVFVTVECALSEFGLVIDFNQIKPLVKTLVDELDEHWLIPGEHPELTCVHKSEADGAQEGGEYEVAYRKRRYLAPAAEIIVLPVNNVSVENLASWIADQLIERFMGKFPDTPLLGMKVSVEETLGQRGVCHWHADV